MVKLTAIKVHSQVAYSALLFMALAVSVIVVILATKSAMAAPGIPPAPTLKIRVVDSSDTLSANQISTLSLQISNSVPNDYRLAVLIVPTMERYPLDMYLPKVARAWGLGAGDSKTALVVIAKDEQLVGVSTGTGVSAGLTGAEQERIASDVIVPQLEGGDLYGAVSLGIDSLSAVMQGKPDPSLRSAWLVHTENVLRGIFNPLVLMTTPLVWLGAVLARTKKFWLGATLGLLAGVGLGFLNEWGLQAYAGLVAIGLVGLIFDLAVTRNYRKRLADSKKPAWWAGGNWSSAK